MSRLRVDRHFANNSARGVTSGCKLATDWRPPTPSSHLTSPHLTRQISPRLERLVLDYDSQFDCTDLFLWATMSGTLEPCQPTPAPTPTPTPISTPTPTPSHSHSVNPHQASSNCASSSGPSPPNRSPPPCSARTFAASCWAGHTCTHGQPCGHFAQAPRTHRTPVHTAHCTLHTTHNHACARRTRMHADRPSSSSSSLQLDVRHATHS